MREPRRVPASITRADGFTLVELLLLLVLLSVLMALFQPYVHRARVRASAAEVVQDLDALKDAVLSYQTEQNQWPPEGIRGIIPPGLEDYLPDGFSFRKPGYVLDYEVWAGQESPPFEIGLSYIGTDQELGLAVMDLLETHVWSDGGSKYTWVPER
jgi:type II secretory pathway pseudopilin PulG